MITAKQYKRTLTKKSGNNSYKDIINEFEEYNYFVNSFLENKFGESHEDRFKRIMRYYNIESYKRIDCFLTIAVAISDLSLTKVEMGRFFKDALRYDIESLKKTDIKEICEYIEKSANLMPVFNTEGYCMKILSGDKYSRPCQYLEQKLITKMIYSKKEILEYYSYSLIEKFLLDISDYIKDAPKPTLDVFLHSFLENHYNKSERVIEKADLAAFLENVTYKFIHIETISSEDISRLYKYMFIEFSEALRKKYKERLKIYKNVCSETCKIFYFDSEFLCVDYEQINSFITEKYDIHYLHKRNEFLWKDGFEKTDKIRSILRNFIKINEEYSW